MQSSALGSAICDMLGENTNGKPPQGLSGGCGGLKAFQKTNAEKQCCKEFPGSPFRWLLLKRSSDLPALNVLGSPNGLKCLMFLNWTFLHGTDADWPTQMRIWTPKTPLGASHAKAPEPLQPSFLQELGWSPRLVEIVGCWPTLHPSSGKGICSDFLPCRSELDKRNGREGFDSQSILVLKFSFLCKLTQRCCPVSCVQCWPPLFLCNSALIVQVPKWSLQLIAALSILLN